MLDYETIKMFMEKYFDYYNRYSQNRETIHMMNDFWGEDFSSKGYFYRENGPSPIVHTSGSQFRDMIGAVHEKIGEQIIPLKMIIDERLGQVAALIRIEKQVWESGERADFTGIAIYGVGISSEGKPILKSLEICVDNPGKLTGMWKY